MTRTSLPTVAVVGAGYAGMTAVGRLAGKAHVILINPVDVFVDRIRLHEYVAGTRTAQATALPLHGHLPAGTSLVVDTAVEVGPGRVDLASGRTIRADHVIAAIGSGASAGMGSFATASRLRNAVARCAPGDRVNILGAGHTGTEMAAEIATARPDLQLTLTDPNGLLPGSSTPARSNAALFMDRHRVEVRHNEPEKEAHALQIDCTGFKVPTLPGLTTPDPTLMVADGLWAAGDGAGTGIRMSCAAAEPMGAHVADNILALTLGHEPENFSLGFVNHALSLGRRQGLIQFTHRDDTPRRQLISGLPGAVGKEIISRMARRVALHSAKRYRWPADAGPVHHSRMERHGE